MYLLFDECCPKSLVSVAQSFGHTAQRTIAIAALGRQASDAAIFAFACNTGGIVVTVNAGDFVALARRSPDHPGLVFLPSRPPAETIALFKGALPTLADLMETAGQIVRIEKNGECRPVPIR